MSNPPPPKAPSQIHLQQCVALWCQCCLLLRIPLKGKVPTAHLRGSHIHITRVTHAALMCQPENGVQIYSSIYNQSYQCQMPQAAQKLLLLLLLLGVPAHPVLYQM